MLQLPDGHTVGELYKMNIGSADDKQLSIDVNELMTHTVVLGSTGSGKTGTIITLIEEALLKGIKVVVIDPKGDLTNLAIRPPVENLSDSDVASRVGKLNTIPHRIYHPGDGSVSIIPNLTKFRGNSSNIVLTLLKIVGYKVTNNNDPAVVYLCDLIDNEYVSSIHDIITFLNEPPEQFAFYNGIEVSLYFPFKQRLKLSRALIGFIHQSSKWSTGKDLDPENLFRGEIAANIFTLNYLTFEEKEMFISILLAEIKNWIFKQGGSSTLKYLLVIDEAAGYIPPYPRTPPTKTSITTLLSQARAYGMGLIIGTQNPNDIDYKALSNVNTWFIGKLRERDLKRDLVMDIESKGVDVINLASMPRQHFLLMSKQFNGLIKIRNTYAELIGPVDKEELPKINARYYNPIRFTVRNNTNTDIIYSVEYFNGFWQKATVGNNKARPLSDCSIVWYHKEDVSTELNTKLRITSPYDQVETGDFTAY